METTSSSQTSGAAKAQLIEVKEMRAVPDTPPNADTTEPDYETELHRDSSLSLSESVQNYPEEFGRTYHAYRAGSYAFPNDVIEQERLGLQNEALKRLFGGRLFFAPLSQSNPPRCILDIATGTGDWAIDMGDFFPTSEVIATDLSPIQPEDVPPNVSFYVEDSSDPWDYTQRFDYIHTRTTAGSWESYETQIAKQAFEYLNPGGYFESQEWDSSICCDDGTLTPDMALTNWFHDIGVAGDIIKRPTVFAGQLKRIYERVGFVDVQQRVFKMPTNAWPKDARLKAIGALWEQNFVQGLSGFSLGLFSRAFNRSPEEIEVSLVDVRRQFCDPSIHAYIPVWVVWGRKPYTNE